MTNEEAIAVLECTESYGFSDELKQAISTAIYALKTVSNLNIEHRAAITADDIPEDFQDLIKEYNEFSWITRALHHQVALNETRLTKMWNKLMEVKK